MVPCYVHCKKPSPHHSVSRLRQAPCGGGSCCFFTACDTILYHVTNTSQSYTSNVFSHILNLILLIFNFSFSILVLCACVMCLCLHSYLTTGFSLFTSCFSGSEKEIHRRREEYHSLKDPYWGQLGSISLSKQ